MTFHDWAETTVVVLNVVFGGILLIARLQVRNWFLEQEKATQQALDDHNGDANAHANHALSVELSDKFEQMMERMGRLITELAVLNDRAKRDKNASDTW